ncbi:MAG: hypothetical protein J6S67_20040 [Methanobrevibacter sp.]|nr:hypothetical protein [Methanobrevibacter sp.]
MIEIEYKDLRLHHNYWFLWKDENGFDRYGSREVVKLRKDRIVIRRVIKGSVCGGIQVDIVPKDQIMGIYKFK